MPYQTYWEKRGILWEFHGAVTADDIAQANVEFYTDSRSDFAQYQIVDTTRVTDLEWSDADIRSMAAHDIGATYALKQMKVVWVAIDPMIDEKLEAYAQLSRRLNSSWEFKGFRSLKEARDWLTDNLRFDRSTSANLISESEDG